MKTAAVHFDEVVLILKGEDQKGRRRRFRLTHKLAPLSSVSMDAVRPVKRKGKKLLPSEYVFHTMHFVTGG